MVHMLNLLTRQEGPLSQIVAPLRRYWTTGEVNFVVEDKEKMIETVGEKYGDGEVDYLDGITVQYPSWWFNVRKSNTEPLLRLILEAESEALLQEKREELVALLGKPI